MRLSQIVAENIPPLKGFSVDQLSDVVVFAGPNGVGKTRLVNTLLQRPQIITAYFPKSRSIFGVTKHLISHLPCDDARSKHATPPFLIEVKTPRASTN